MSSSSRVVITGLGAITSIGAGKDAFWESLKAGRSGVKRVYKFDPEPYPTQIARSSTGSISPRTSTPNGRAAWT